MALGVAQYQAGCLGDDDGVGVAHPGGAQVQALGPEGDMTVFGDILGVDYHTAVGHSALVEYLAQKYIQCAELGVDLSEIQSPAGSGLVGRQHAGMVDFVQPLDQAGAADEYLARGTGIVGERLSAESHQVGFRRQLGVLEGVRRLVPDSAGQKDVVVLVGIGNRPLVAEQEILLHPHAHIYDGGFLLVGEGPSYLLVGDFHERGLLHLGLIKV